MLIMVEELIACVKRSISISAHQIPIVRHCNEKRRATHLHTECNPKGGGGGRAQNHVVILLRLYEDHGALPKHKVSCSEKSGPVASSAYMDGPKTGPTTEHEIR